MPEPVQEPTVEQRNLVALSLIPGLGPRKIRMLMSSCGSASRVFEAPRSHLLRISGIGKHLADQIGGFRDFDTIDDQFQKAASMSAAFVSIADSTYPLLLRQIYDPPPFLWVVGRRDIEWQHCIAVVGTRRPSAYGKRATRSIVRQLCEQRCVIVSGLAYGIDAVAHRETIFQGAHTVAVLGSGLDVIYPGSHRELADDISNHGCIISTFPFGTQPDAPNFPQRNRLISGISRATLVTEAFNRGGALITASMALDQNREVFAVPGPIFSPSSAGTNWLIKEGTAKLIQNVDDILVEIGIDKITHRTDSANFRNLPDDLTTIEQRVVDILQEDRTHIDTICKAAKLDAAVTLSILLQLELKGVVRQDEGYLFARL